MAINENMLAKLERLERAAEELITYSRKLNELLPIDEFRCPYMRELEAAWKELETRRIRLCARFPYRPTIGGACGMYRPPSALYRPSNGL